MRMSSRLESPSSPQRNAKRAIPLLLVAVLALACERAFAATQPFEKLTPEGPVFYVSVKSVPDLLGKLKATPQYKLFTDPRMEKVVAKLSESLKEETGDIPRMLGVDPKELEKMLGGQISLAILPRGDRDAHFLLLADVNKDPNMAETVLQNILKYSREENGRYAVKEDTFHGKTIWVIEPIETKGNEPKEGAAPEPPALRPQAAAPGNEEDEEGALMPDEQFQPELRKENPGFISLSDGILAIVSSPDRSLIEKYLVLREGGDVPALAGMEAFKRLGSYMGADRDATIFADFRALAKQEEKGTAMPEMVPGLSDMLGTGNVAAFGCGLTLRQDGLAAQGLLLAPAPAKGFLRAFASRGGNVMPPAYVDKNVGVFGGMHFSLPIMWEEFKAAMQRESPESYAQFEVALKNQPFDIENDVIKSLGDRWFFYVPAGSGGKTGDLQAALCIDLQNSAALSGAVQQMLANVPQEFVQTVDFAGVKVYQLGASSEFATEEAASPSICVAVLQDKFLYASSLDLAKSIINNDRREASPLATDTAFQKLLGQTIENPDGVLLLDGRVIAQWMLRQAEKEREMFRKIQEENNLPPGAGKEAAPELSELPPADVVAKLQTTMMVAAKWNDDGIVVKAWSPHPQPEQ